MTENFFYDTYLGVILKTLRVTSRKKEELQNFIHFLLFLTIVVLFANNFSEFLINHGFTVEVNTSYSLSNAHVGC